MVQLTDSQRAAVNLVSESNLSLLTGGGGTGKTTLLAEWIKETPDMLTYCFAPTGKAAQRMEEAFRECGVSLKAKTTHAGLLPTRTGYDGRGWQFEYNQKNPLPCDRVIADEQSMADNSAMTWLLAAIKPGTKVVLVGDDSQLAPVGKGRPFKDMIEAGVLPHAHLTEVHRYAGRIAHVCKSVREGKKVVPSPSLNMDPDASEFGPDNFRHIERRNSREQLLTLDVLCDRVRDRGFDPVTDMQVVVTRNKVGGISREDVNPRLQELLNPDGGRYSKCPFRIGDKVICKRNNYRETHVLIGSKPEKDGYKTYVANGEDGLVRFIDDSSVFVEFREGMVRFPRGSWGTEVVMGYALTCHSSQGSGWPVVVYLIDDCRLNDRNLVYTGLSRPKKLLFTIGRLNTLNQQIQKSQLDTRKTFLQEKLTRAMKGAA